nr:MAG TPA: hypothetical protein [Caudoviricetes sp.]
MANNSKKKEQENLEQANENLEQAKDNKENLEQVKDNDEKPKSNDDSLAVEAKGFSESAEFKLNSTVTSGEVKDGNQTIIRF